MKVSGAVARMPSGASGEIDGPVEKLKPVNWLIRNVRTAQYEARYYAQAAVTWRT